MPRVAEHFYAPNITQSRHAHAETTVTMVLAGGLREIVGSSNEYARAFSIVVKPGDTEHADEFGPVGAKTLQIVLPEDEAQRVLAWLPAMRTWHWLHAGSSVKAFLTLLQVVRDSKSTSNCLETAAFDALASIDATHSAPAPPPSWLRIVREALDDTPAARLAALAEIAGVHPVYLARQFRRAYGCSVGDYVRRRKVERAAELAADPTLTLSAVAYGAGFADQAHLCRTFRAETGLTPGGYRSLVAG
jgi:AraC family transcriptional regulator